MKQVDRIEYFNCVLSLIKDDTIREFCIQLLNDADDYFFEKPASSSGKYHPEYSLGDGGLARHSMAVAIILNDILETGCYKFSDTERDLLICAAIVHDIKKYGNGHTQHTVKNHPELACEYIKNEGVGIVNEDLYDKVSELVETHMGQYGNKKPKTTAQKLLHIADCLASRRYLNMDFNKTELPNAKLISESKVTPKENVGDFVYPFGKYKGKKIKDVYNIDKSYLNFMAYMWEGKDSEASIKSRLYLETTI